MRVKFKLGEQRKFLNLVVERLNCVSVRGILERGFKIKYNSLKNYYSERRLMNKDFFDDLCHLGKINKNKLEIKYLDEYWGRSKGGKISKRKKIKQ